MPSGSGAQIPLVQSEAWETEDLQVMSSSPKTGALDRQAGFPRVPYRFSFARDPASISFDDPTRGESILQVQRGSE